MGGVEVFARSVTVTFWTIAATTGTDVLAGSVAALGTALRGAEGDFAKPAFTGTVLTDFGLVVMIALLAKSASDTMISGIAMKVPQDLDRYPNREQECFSRSGQMQVMG